MAYKFGGKEMRIMASKGLLSVAALMSRPNTGGMLSCV